MKKRNKLTRDDLAYILGIVSVIMLVLVIHKYPLLIGR